MPLQMSMVVRGATFPLALAGKETTCRPWGYRLHDRPGDNANLLLIFARDVRSLSDIQEVTTAGVRSMTIRLTPTRITNLDGAGPHLLARQLEAQPHDTQQPGPHGFGGIHKAMSNPATQ